MAILVIQTANRAVLRRAPHLQRHSRLTKRYNATNTPSTPPPPPPSATGAAMPKANLDTAATQGASIPVPNTVAPLPLWQRLGPLSKAFSAYGRSQRQRPYTTQFFSALVIYFCGDLSAQSISGEDYDPARTVRSLIIGAGSSIPSYKWFMFLGNHFNYSSLLLSLATKVVVNQAVFTPIFNTYFFGMQALLSGHTLPETWEHIKRTVPTSAINSCKLWPAVTAFNFRFISAQYRNIFAGFIAIGWQTYLSYLNRKAENAEAHEKMEKGSFVDVLDDVEEVVGGGKALQKCEA